jgi:hypothetical protein
MDTRVEVARRQVSLMVWGDQRWPVFSRAQVGKYWEELSTNTRKTDMPDRVANISQKYNPNTSQNYNWPQSFNKDFLRGENETKLQISPKSGGGGRALRPSTVIRIKRYIDLPKLGQHI